MNDQIGLVVSATDQATPVVNRVTQSVGQLGQRTEQMGNQSQSAFSRIQQGYRKMTGAVAEYSLKVTAAGFAVKKLFDIMVQQEKVQNMEKALSMRADWAGYKQQLDNTVSSLGGLVTKMDLIPSLSKGLALGVDLSGGNFERLTIAAQKASIVMGTDLATATEDLMLGLGRQSKMILDNLGVIVSAEEAYENWAKKMNRTVESMTDLEKKAAFQAEGVKKLEEAYNHIDLTEFETKMATTDKKMQSWWENIKKGALAVGVAIYDFVEEGAEDWAEVIHGKIGGAYGEINKYIDIVQNKDKSFYMGIIQNAEQLDIVNNRVGKEYKNHKELISAIYYRGKEIEANEKLIADRKKAYNKLLVQENKLVAARMEMYEKEKKQWKEFYDKEKADRERKLKEAERDIEKNEAEKKRRAEAVAAHKEEIRLARLKYEMMSQESSGYTDDEILNAKRQLEILEATTADEKILLEGLYQKEDSLRLSNQNKAKLAQLQRIADFKAANDDIFTAEEQRQARMDVLRFQARSQEDQDLLDSIDADSEATKRREGIFGDFLKNKIQMAKDAGQRILDNAVEEGKKEKEIAKETERQKVAMAQESARIGLQMIDALVSGEEDAIPKILLAAGKAIGGQMIMDGLRIMMTGKGEGFLGNPFGWSAAGIGAAMVTTGTAMYTGASLGLNALGDGGGGSDTSAMSSKERNSTNQNQDINVNVRANLYGSKTEAQLALKKMGVSVNY